MLVREDLLDRASARLITAVTLLDNVVDVALGALLFSVFTEMPFSARVNLREHFRTPVAQRATVSG